MSEELLRTVLHGEHLRLNARMVEFGGWDMPVQYTGIIDEHRAVRERAGLFDVSHMGEFWVTGPDALAFLQHVTTADVSQLAIGQAGYALFCRPDGGVVDDLFIYRLGEQRYLLVVNASNIAKDWQWIQPFTSNFAVTLGDASPATALMALQGPGAEAVLASLIGDVAVTLLFHGVVDSTLLGQSVIIARTGYTGEDGFEIFCANAHAVAIWQALLAAGATPCGLGARDSLRFEPCLALYGHELADDINPYEARLGWAVKLSKGAFVGSAALNNLKSNYTRRLVAFEVTGKGIARGGYAVHDTHGHAIGVVTTGMPSPTFGKPLGIALIARAEASEGTQIDIIVRDKPVRAVVVKYPFYQSRYKK
ncbi:MAG: glycine cleavage system aminomethyltransferase GcvT [Chloroflexales bacterium]|nr:glycine cleavage system aminomethyltransferase GcvT [Chloroflexales bacterium]